MRITRIDHVAVCVADLDAALPHVARAARPARRARASTSTRRRPRPRSCSRRETAGCTVELIAPKGGNPGLEKFLDKNSGRSGLHHIAFAVDDLAGALRELDARGVPLIDKVPRPGARGHRSASCIPRPPTAILIELVSDHAHAHTQGRH